MGISQSSWWTERKGGWEGVSRKDEEGEEEREEEREEVERGSRENMVRMEVHGV